MMMKILGVVVLAAYVQAQGHATSYVVYGGGGGEIAPSVPSPGVHNYYAAPVQVEHNHDEHHSHPKYQFKYGVEDRHSGDIKSHEETRDGDVVRGQYSLHEPDGTVLTVKYTVDKKSGFNAEVLRQGQANHPQHMPSGRHH